MKQLVLRNKSNTNTFHLYYTEKFLFRGASFLQQCVLHKRATKMLNKCQLSGKKLNLWFLKMIDKEKVNEKLEYKILQVPHIYCLLHSNTTFVKQITGILSPSPISL